MSFTDLLDLSATIKRKVDTTSGQGEVTSAWPTTVATGVPFGIQPAKGGMTRYAVGEDVEAVFAGYCLYGQDLVETDKVIVGAIEYDVRFVRNVRNHHLEAVLTRGLQKG